jgi:hypothetical protein
MNNKMKHRTSRLLSALAAVILLGCGSVQQLAQATATPTVTDTPTIPPTATSTPTRKPTPTKTPDVAATLQLEKFGELMSNYYSFGPVESMQGRYFPQDDYSDQLAQKGYFSWLPSDLRLRDVLLRADVVMTTANTPSNSTGCGIMFRTVGDFHESIFILQSGELNYGAGDTVFNSRNRGKFSNPAEFEVVFVLKDNHYQVFIDGETAMKGDSILTPSAGGISFAVQSGSDEEFGSKCDFKNIDLWAIKEK